MALLTERRSGMQTIFFQANCKMHEANYHSRTAYGEVGRVFIILLDASQSSQSVSRAPHGVTARRFVRAARKLERGQTAEGENHSPYPLHLFVFLPSLG